ncbi:MAG: FAD:protein FMN transferase [Planctomycetaceae bacterium]|nr:FAD:protein FMN transferase [Planctomycetaceae bacterium]
MKDNFEVVFERELFPQGTAASMDALDEVERLEKMLSVFRFDSKIQYINSTAHEEPVAVEPELFDLMTLCLDFAELTGGAVDITSGPLWKIWGFAKREGRVPSDVEIADTLKNVDYRSVQLDSGEHTVTFTKSGIELNFGCVGKGFAVDAGAKKLREQGVDRFRFQGGLSSILAEGADWTFGIAHPLRPGQRLTELTLNNAAVATSGSDKQFFRHKGHRYSHIIDPRTGRPAEGVLSATVIAPTGTLAELLSTAFFVLGPDWAEKYCAEHSDVSALFVLPARKGNLCDVRRIGIDCDRPEQHEELNFC